MLSVEGTDLTASTREMLGCACREARPLLLDVVAEFMEPLNAPPLGRLIPELPDEEAQNARQHELLAV